jgi:hypothetical protein
MHRRLSDRILKRSLLLLLGVLTLCCSLDPRHARVREHFFADDRVGDWREGREGEDGEVGSG